MENEDEKIIENEKKKRYNELLDENRGYERINIKSKALELLKKGISLETLNENSKIQDEYLEKLKNKNE
jgi:hypothetical protein